MIELHHADCLDLLPTLPASSVHAVVTDPPYHLTNVSRGGHARTNNPEGPFGRHRIGDKGFMGKNWDGGDVAFQTELWAEVLRVMRPGAYLLAFGGTRTYHRMVCAIEDAGFEVRDMVSWIYGSGFPKGTDRAKIPADWQGFNTALKPALEPICLARKPMVGALATNLQLWGCGALNVDGCRIDTEGPRPMREARPRGEGTGIYGNELHGSRVVAPVDIGRWPANVVHDGSDEVLQGFPDAPGQQGDLTGSEPSRPALNVYGDFPAPKIAPARGDEGSTARFFYCAKADREDRDHGVNGDRRVVSVWGGDQDDLTVGKKSTVPRGNHHPTVKPTELMRWLVRLVTPPGGTVLDPFMGSGSTGRAAVLERFNFIGIEREAEYMPIARARIGVVDPASFTLAAQRAG